MHRPGWQPRAGLTASSVTAQSATGTTLAGHLADPAGCSGPSRHRPSRRPSRHREGRRHPQHRIHAARRTCARGSGKPAGALLAGVLDGHPALAGRRAHMRRASQRPVAQARSRQSPWCQAAAGQQ